MTTLHHDASLTALDTITDLKQHKRRLEGIIDTAIDGIITVDAQQTILLVNPAAALMFGYPVETLLGSSLNTLIPARHRHNHGQHVVEFGDTGITRRKMGDRFDDFYVTGLRSDESEFPIEASISSLIENGQRYFTVIFRDITERKIAKEEIAHSHEQLRDLSTALQSIREEERKHIARELHDDLGQILAALRMDLSLLQRDVEISGKNQATLQSMDKLILTSITTLRRIATDLRPRALDEGGLYFALQTLQKDFSSRHGIDCELLADEDQLILDDARSTAIFRIVQESLTNVARHAKASEVQIQFARDAERLHLTISDNGRGIEPQNRHKSGSLGLVGMRERIKALGGEFTVHSKPYEGTRLTIWLPLA
jgi:PAS domain S-box-containing protein